MPQICPHPPVQEHDSRIMPAARKSLLLLQCEVLADSLPAMCAASGDTDVQFRRALEGEPALQAGSDALPWAVTRVCAGETPPPLDTVAGVVISGSSAMVDDPAAWIGQTRAWLSQALEAGLPVLGVCFGHQLLAHLLGGRVDFMAQGPEYASVTVRLTPEAAGDRLLGHLPERFQAQSAHYQSVLTAPPGAVVLAEGDSGIQALRFTPNTWGVQFHPEFSAGDQRLLLEALGTRLHAAGRDVASDLRRVTATPEARSVLPCFHQLVSDSLDSRAHRR